MHNLNLQLYKNYIFYNILVLLNNLVFYWTIQLNLNIYSWKKKNRLKYLWGSSVYLDLDTAELNRKYKKYRLKKVFLFKNNRF